MIARSVAVSFQSGETARRERTQRRADELRALRPPRVTKTLVLAHMVQREIRAGEYVDYADVARSLGISRARMTQLMSLLLLAPDIQEDVLLMRFPAGREPIGERHLRLVFRHPLWDDQRNEWEPIKRRGEAEVAEAIQRAETGR